MTKTIFPDTTHGTRPKSFLFFSSFDLLFCDTEVIVLGKHFRCQSVGAKAFFWGKVHFSVLKCWFQNTQKIIPAWLNWVDVHQPLDLNRFISESAQLFAFPTNITNFLWKAHVPFDWFHLFNGFISSSLQRHAFGLTSKKLGNLGKCLDPCWFVKSHHVGQK